MSKQFLSIEHTNEWQKEISGKEKLLFFIAVLSLNGVSFLSSVWNGLYHSYYIFLGSGSSGLGFSNFLDYSLPFLLIFFAFCIGFAFTNKATWRIKAPWAFSLILFISLTIYIIQIPILFNESASRLLYFSLSSLQQFFSILTTLLIYPVIANLTSAWRSRTQLISLTILTQLTFELIQATGINSIMSLMFRFNIPLELDFSSPDTLLGNSLSIISLILGLCGLGAIIWLPQRLHPYKEQTIKNISRIWSFFREPFYLRYLLAVFSIFWGRQFIFGALIKYFPEGDFRQQIAFLLGIGALLGAIAFSNLSMRYERRTLLLSALGLMVIASALRFVFSATSLFGFITFLLQGIGAGGVTWQMFALLVEFIDYAEWKTGLRTEGLVVVFNQVILAIALIASFPLFFRMGFYPSGNQLNAPQLNQSFIILTSLVPAICFGIPFLLFWLHPLSKAKMAEISADLIQKRLAPKTTTPPPPLSQFPWIEIEQNIDSLPYHLRYREFPETFPYVKFAQRVTFKWNMSGIYPETRMPIKSESTALWFFERNFVELIEKEKIGILALVHTGNGQRKYVFYTEHTDPLLSLLESDSTSRHPYPIDAEIDHDPHWSTYISMKKSFTQYQAEKL